jgi:DNA-binding CsgD family transcriptional regulator
MTALTPRQSEVLRLRFEGLSCDEVGARLGIAEMTVRNHLREAYLRLGVSRQMDAFRAAGMIVPDPPRSPERDAAVLGQLDALGIGFRVP